MRVRKQLRLDMPAQPDDITCGPTCLHAVYAYYGDDLPLDQTIAETPQLHAGGTLAVMLACHALRRGYDARIFTYNLTLFDLSWFELDSKALRKKLEEQAEFKQDPKLRFATDAYIEFLDLGGVLRFEPLTSSLIRRHLHHGVPLLTGLSATYLYQCQRERPTDNEYDDIRGEPSGHFVVVCGIDRMRRKVLVADPQHDNPGFESHLYEVDINRLIGAIFLGVLTYDANLLAIIPRPDRTGATAS